MSLVLTVASTKTSAELHTETIRSLSPRQLTQVISHLIEDKPLYFNQLGIDQDIYKALDPDGRLRNFTSSNPDFKAWFANFFPYINQQDINLRLTPIGVVFELQAGAYSKFVSQEGIRIKDSEPISLGVTLRLARLPQDLHDLFVVINRGNRSEQSCEKEIKDTANHEILHLLFNKFFCKAPFISSSELAQRLSKIDCYDLKSYQSLAKDLANGMIELSRSEVISYFGTGYYNVQVPHLCANFWRQHSKEIVKHLSKFPKEQRDQICRFFLDACHEYVRDTRAFIKFAKDLVEQGRGNNPSELIADLILGPNTIPHINLSGTYFKDTPLKFAA